MKNKTRKSSVREYVITGKTGAGGLIGRGSCHAEERRKKNGRILGSFRTTATKDQMAKELEGPGTNKQSKKIPNFQIPLTYKPHPIGTSDRNEEGRGKRGDWAKWVVERG